MENKINIPADWIDSKYYSKYCWWYSIIGFNTSKERNNE